MKNYSISKKLNVVVFKNLIVSFEKNKILLQVQTRETDRYSVILENTYYLALIYNRPFGLKQNLIVMWATVQSWIRLIPSVCVSFYAQ